MELMISKVIMWFFYKYQFYLLNFFFTDIFSKESKECNNKHDTFRTCLIAFEKPWKYFYPMEHFSVLYLDAEILEY